MHRARKYPYVSGDRVVSIMAKAPRAGHVKTRLAAVCDADQLVRLYRVLVEDTIALVRAIGATVAIVCPAHDAAAIEAWLPDIPVLPQRGHGLADGLTSVFELLCDAQRPVVALNGDSPHLSPEALESAFVALLDHDLVVGPSVDGGYYLVGAARPHHGLFDVQAMGTDSALSALVARSQQLGLSLQLSAEHYDIDVPADLVRLTHELRESPHRARRTAELLAGWNIADADMR